MKGSAYSEETLQLLNALGARPIAYHPAFARVWGVKAAILLGQLIYWHGKQSNTEGWIRKTVAEIDEETALSEYEQETARSALAAAGVIEYKRMGVPAMPHFRISHDAILAALTAGKDEHKSAEQDSAKAPNQLGENHLSSSGVHSGNLIGENHLSVQEITTKNTTETTSKMQGGARKVDHDAAARAAGIHNQKPPRKSRKAEPPAQANITPAMLDHFAVSAHRQIMGVLLDAFCMEQIIARVTDEAAWRECLTDWRLHTNWKHDNIAGQLDRYANWQTIKAQAASATPLKHPQPEKGALTGAARIAQETYERQMRGIQSAVETATGGGWYGNA